MRVVFVTDILTPYMAAVLGELAGLVDLKAVFCSHTGTRGMDWDFSTGLDFRHEVVGGATLRRRRGWGTDYYLDPRILRSIAGHRGHAVVSGGYSGPTAYAALWCRAARRPLLIHSDGTSHSEREISGAQRAARSLLLRQASVCVANSRPAADRFRELGVAPDRLLLARHSTRIEPFWQVARERAGASRNGRGMLVLAVGRLMELKGYDRLIRALALARRDDASIALRFVGSGPDEPALRELAADLGLGDAVEFAGFVDRASLPRHYADADAFAQPSIRDTFGFTVLEAAAAGLPILASPYAGATGDLIVVGQNGLVVDPRDERALAAALVRLSRDPRLRERLGRAAHAATAGRTPADTARGYRDAVLYAREHPGRALR